MILSSFGIRDEMLRDDWRGLHPTRRIIELIKNTIELLILAAVALPGGLLVVIPGGMCRLFAQYRARSALKSSTVKIKGYDVMLTSKV